MRFPNPKLFLLACLRFFRRPELTPDRVAAIREARCQLCPHHSGGQCQICTCIVDIKVRLATESCPDTPPHWKEYYNFKSNGL